MYSNARAVAASAPSFVYLIYICIYTCRHGGADIDCVRDVQVDVHEHHVVDMQASAVNEDVGIFQKHWSVTLPSVSIKRQCVMLRASDEMLTPHFVSLRPSASYGIE